MIKLKRLLYVLCTCMYACTITGCTLLWTDTYFYASLLNMKEASSIVIDSNDTSTHLNVQNYKSDPEDTETYTPYGIIKTGE